WRTSARMQGWVPSALLLLIFLLVLPLDDAGGFVQTFPFLADARLLEIVMPLAMGIQAALLFSPADEKPLELLLVTKRPLAWLAIERLGVMLVLQGGLALLATGVLSASGAVPGSVGVSIARWLAPGLLFVGLGVFVTLSTRQSLYGLGMVVLAFFGLQMTGPHLLTRWPDAWPVAPFLDAASVSSGEYALNRAILIGIGMGLIGWGLHTLRDTEMLFDRRKSRASSPLSSSPLLHLPSSPLLGVIRYEMLLLWRARMIPLIFAVITGIFLLNAGYNRIQYAGEFTALAEGLPPEAVRDQITQMALGTLTGLTMIIVILMPLFTADARPKDHQFGVVELLETLPVRVRTLLSGKLLGSWGVVLIGLAGMFGLAIGWERVLFGSLAMKPLGELFFLTALPLGVYTSGMGLLLASGQATRRRAMMIALAFVGIYGILLGLLTTGTARDAWLGNPAVFLMYHLRIPGVTLYTREDLWLASGSVMVQLAVVWGLVVVWNRFKRLQQV
ncbi:MAG TPA: hypothetical protein PK530_15015, partial [Anaerolineales bacterium]|nr:hypothetical protein [Anaerolineales bacterium]